ncbi:hypothetical protein F8388_024288 [Cannabis sativa]|uniref:Oleosin n=1 Tax=Cannabis sativa TaxID=3483 RepID=A0A7J6E7R8_CANSA|nr:hypothetical protein F8388_024288 [Cannabis sativa]KAF4387664.1 hypothetical protein G4B88_003991 [Cannabis sativa]
MSPSPCLLEKKSSVGPLMACNKFSYEISTCLYACHPKLHSSPLTVTILALILFSPLIILTIPIWVPIGCFLIAITAAFLSFCGFGVAAVAVAAWVYKYFRGLHPPGSDRVDYARSRIYDTASHVKDYAREYGGYLQSKAKDAAPGA